VKVGQDASFHRQRLPGRQYPARITRVGFGSTITDNVVTYLTYLDVDNSDLSLRPGMTATATITATQRSDVLLVPNSALRFTPTRRRRQGGAKKRHRRQPDAARRHQQPQVGRRRRQHRRGAPGVGAARRRQAGGPGRDARHQRRPHDRDHRRRAAIGMQVITDQKAADK
jgi:HlyD family secretion protein